MHDVPDPPQRWRCPPRFAVSSDCGQGSLAEAEADLRISFECTEAAGLEVNRPARAWLARALADQGRVAEADAERWAAWPSDEIPSTGAWWWFSFGRAHVLLAQERWAEASAAFIECGENYSAYGWTNPALIPWRSDAAIALRALGDITQGSVLAEQELSLAESWGGRRALGNALRVASMFEPLPEAAELLNRSLASLDGTTARLDLARSLVASGTVHARLGDRPVAVDRLTRGLHLAAETGAMPLVSEARNALRALGLRPRRTMLTGVGALTASERRVAELAGLGHTTRQIAEELYVTVKTVETHLAATYKKLSITNRRELLTHLNTPHP